MSTNLLDTDESDSDYIPEGYLTPSRRIEREELMAIANDLIRFLHSRTMSTRFREQKGDKLRLDYARVELNAIRAYATLLKDEEIEDLQKRIAALEAVNARRTGK